MNIDEINGGVIWDWRLRGGGWWLEFVFIGMRNSRNIYLGKCADDGLRSDVLISRGGVLHRKEI